MLLQANTWYDKTVRPPSWCELILSNGIVEGRGYYYDHRFYVDEVDVTYAVTKWRIPEEKAEQEVHCNCERSK